MAKELRTVLRSDGTPELQIVRDADTVVIYEADDMDRQVAIPVAVIPALTRALGELL